MFDHVYNYLFTVPKPVIQYGKLYNAFMFICYGYVYGHFLFLEAVHISVSKFRKC